MLIKTNFYALVDCWTCDFGDGVGQHNWIIGNEYEMSLFLDGTFTITSESGTSIVSVDIVNVNLVRDLTGIDIWEYIITLENSSEVNS